MLKQFPRIALAAFLIASCGQAPQEAATGFVTQQAAAPASAEDSRGDGVMRDGDGRPFGYALLGEALPDFTAEQVGGGTFDSASIDTWTVIDVWGIWCSDCMADAPYAAALARAIAQDPELDFLSIHVPASAVRADEAFGRFGSVEAYFDDVGYAYPTLVDRDGSLRERLQIAWTPTYLLVSPDGVVRGFRTDLSVAGDQPVKTFLQDIAAVRAATPVAAGASQPTGPSIGPGGVARLSRHTPFTQRDMEAAFAPLTVRAATETTEGEPYPVFHVEASSEAGGGTLYTVEPSWDRGHVGAVRTRHAWVSGPMGTRIGETRLGDLPEAARSDCQPGVDEYDDALFCTVAEGDARFAFVFRAPREYDRYFPDAPDAVKLDGRLVEMRYLPPQRN